MIKGKIDVSKIDKAGLFKGAKGTYLDVILWETPDDKFGNDYRITQDLGKEARQAGKRGAILGNAKIYAKPGGSATAAQSPDTRTVWNEPTPAQTENLDEDVPF